ncbi:MAG TPA: hypothetical protein VGL53_17210 [Bryobacteraceae bacterium]|jgi:hypothetical protein
MGTHIVSPEYVAAQTEGPQPNRESQSSGVSWGAVIGGAFVASALYLILLALGAGFGLSAVSPWANSGASASTVGTLAIIWLIVIEIVASGFGGYLTGRLRTKWTLIHSDEVFFRDTANGFLAWAVALIVSAAFLASAATSMAGSAEQARASSANAPAAAISSPNMYFVDELFRSDHITAEAGDTAAKVEAERIMLRGLKDPQMQSADQAYLSRIVAARTGLSQPDAEKRVADVITDARQAEDTARKATAHFLLWLFLSLLMGAFSASYAATVGGRQRDHVKAVK